MELNFGLLVFAALVGLIINAIYGWNPVAILSSISLLVLMLPLLAVAIQKDPQVALSMADDYTATVVLAMPSFIMGELAGNIAGEIFKPFKRLF